MYATLSRNVFWIYGALQIKIIIIIRTSRDRWVQAVICQCSRKDHLWCSLVENPVSIMVIVNFGTVLFLNQSHSTQAGDG